MTNANHIVNDALVTAMHAMQTTVATALGSCTASLDISRGMFLNVPPFADWQAIACNHELHVNENLHCAYRKCHQYDFALGQQVLKKMHDPTKLGVRTEGPYTIEHVHINGNHTIVLCGGVTKHINIRRALLDC
jgi:hypothetical protein